MSCGFGQDSPVPQTRKLKLKCCDLRAHYYEGEACSSLNEDGSWVEKGPIIRSNMKKQ